jgi:hypothetical protein
MYMKETGQERQLNLRAKPSFLELPTATGQGAGSSTAAALIRDKLQNRFPRLDASLMKEKAL